MAVVIDIDVTQARANVASLNADITAIAASAGSIKSAFAGADFLSGIVQSAAAAKSAIDSLNSSANVLNTTMQAGIAGLTEYTNTSRGVVGVVQAAATAVQAKATAMAASTAVTREAAQATQVLSAAEAQAAMRWTSQEKVIRSTITAANLKKTVLRELAELELSGQITMNQSLRYQEQMATTYAHTGTAAEVLLTSLRSQNAAYFQNNAALAEATAGYNTMTSAQQRHLRTQLDIASAFKATDSLLNNSASIMGEYNANLMHLDTLYRNGAISQTQLKSATELLNTAFDQQLGKVRESQRAMDAKSYADSEAAKQEKAVADAMQRTNSVMQRGLDPVQQYVARLRDLNTALAGAATQSGGRLGITMDQYRAGLSGARAELERNIIATTRAQTVQQGLNHQFNIGTQAAAGFRAGLQGAGVGFGIFTSQTIVAASAVYGVTKAIKESITSGMEFQEAFQRAGAMLDMFDLKTGKPIQSFAALRAQVMGLSETTRFSSTEVSESLVALGQAGQTAAEAMKTLPVVLDFATVGQLQTDDAANKLINTLTAFGLKAEDAAHASDLITKASLVSTTTISELSIGLSQVGSTAHTAGVGLTETLGALAAMRQSGIQASKTGTDLRNIIQSLAAPTSAASQSFKDLNIDVNDFYKDGALNLSAMLTTLSDKFENLSKRQQTALAKEWFNRRSATGFQALINSMADAEKGVQAMTDKVANAQGATASLADIINNNAKVAFQQLGHTIENVAIDAFELNEVELTASIREFSEFVRANGPAISQTIADITKTVVDMTGWIVRNGDTLITAFVTYEAWRTAMATGQGVTRLWERVLASYSASIALNTAAQAENTLVTNANTAASARNAVAKEAEALANNAAAVAAGRATVAAGAAAGAAVGAGSAMAGLKATGSGLLALLGGWPTVLLAAAGGLAYLAYSTHKANQEIEVDVNGLNDRFQVLKGSVDQLNALDFSGARRLGEQFKNEIKVLEEANVAIQHNIDLLKQQQVQRQASARSVGADRGSYVETLTPTPAAIALMAEYERQQVLINYNLQEAKRLADVIELDAMFKSPSAQSLITAVQTLQTELQTTDTAILSLGSVVEGFWGGLGIYVDAIGRSFDIAGFKATDLFQRLSPYFTEEFGPPRTLMRNEPIDRPIDTEGGDFSAKSQAASQFASQLKTIVTEFQKATDAAALFGGEFKQLVELKQKLADGELSKELAKVGVTAAEAGAALDWKMGSVAFETLKKRLTDLNPAFAALKDPAQDVVNTSDDINVAFKAVDDTTAEMVAAVGTVPDTMRAAIEGVREQLPNLLSGAQAALDEFDKNIQNVEKSIGKVFAADGFDAFIGKVKETGREMTPATVGANAWAEAVQILGGNEKAAARAIQEATNAGKQAADMQAVYLALTQDPRWKGHEAQLAAIGVAFQNVYNKTPLGAIQLENQNLENQIALMRTGVKDLTVYNQLWQATGGNAALLSDELVAAAEKQRLLNEEFARMQEVQATFKGFAESLGAAFGEFFMNVDDGWDDLVGNIKSSFKKLLQDLITQAITNQILFYFGFNQSGYGGGGGSMGSWMGAIASMFGMGAMGGGGGSNDLVSSMVGAASAANAGYTGVGGPSGGGGSFGGTSGFTNLYSAGRTGYQYATGQLSNPLTYANGRVMPGSNYFGSYVYGPTQAGGTMGYYSPTALGYGAAIGTGLVMGYNRYQDRYDTGTGLAAGATYAVGGTALALGVGSMLAGGSFAAGVGAMAGTAAATGTAAAGAGTAAAAGTMAAIPVIGWIALILMAIDMLSGGQLFGTSANKFVGGATNTTISDSGADMSAHYTLKGQKPLFGGSYYREKPMDISPEMQAQADKLYKEIHQVAVSASRQLGVDVATGIEGEFEAQFNKKGEVTKTISTVLGKTYEEPLEDFVKRMQAEQIIALVDKSIASMGSSAAEATKIADMYRTNAADLMDVAQVMLQAQTDIKNSEGLLRESGAGVLTETITIVQALQASGESMQQTYARLMAETALVDEVFGAIGATMAKTGTEFVQFADDFVLALGGLDQATAKWNIFAGAVFGSIGYITQATSSGKVGGELTELGLDPATTIEEFAIAFGKVADSLDAEALANWVQAGADLALISNTMMSLQGMADGADISGLLSQQQQLVQSVNQQISMAAALGASEEELAQMRELGQQAIARTLTDFMAGIDSEIAKFEGGDWLYQLDQINLQMRRNINSARALGASEEQLARIQELAAYQTASLIAELEASITSLVDQLHGNTGQQESAYQSVADQGRSAIVDAQRELYSAAQSAIESITEFLNSLETGSLSTQGWQGQLGSARSQFDELVAAAQGGDVNAMEQLTDYAQTYLQHAQDAYGNSTAYGDIFNYVTDILRNLRAQFELIQEPPAASAGGGGGDASAVTRVTLTEEDRFQLSLQIAQQLGALGVALDTSVWDLMDSFGVTIAELAENLGIDLTAIDENFFESIEMLAAALHVDSLELLTHLGVLPEAIGAFFQVSAASINEGNLANIVTMAEALGISVFEAITYMGGDLALAIAANGIDINSLDPVSMFALGEIARVLGVDIVTLLQNLGLDITSFAGPLANAIGTDLAAIPGIADATVEGMKPLLIMLAMALNEGDLNAALGSINDYLDTLPEDQRLAIETLFTNLGIDLDSTEILEAQSDLQATIAENTTTMADQLGTIGEALTGGIADSLTNIEGGAAYLVDILDVLRGMGGEKAAGASGGGGGFGGGGGTYYTPPGEATAAQQLHDIAVTSDEAQQRTAETAEQMRKHISELNEQVATLTNVISSKLDMVGENQKSTTAGVKTMAKKVTIMGMKKTVRRQ